MIDRYKCYFTFLMIGFWLIAGFGFIADELITPLLPFRTVFRMLSDLVFACLGLKVINKRSDIIIVLSFVALSFLSTVMVNHLSVVYWVNGMREFIGWMFIFPIARWFFQPEYRERFLASFDRFVFIYLVLQAPCLIIQFLRYGAGDAGGGTWGHGYSGIVSISICFGSYYLMTRRWNLSLTYWENIKENKVLIFLLFPTLLNETKITFFLIPIYFLLLLKTNRAFGLKVLAASPLILIFFVGFGWLYLQTTNQDGNEVFSVDNFEYYLTGGDDNIELIDLAEALRDNPELSDDAEMNVWTVDLPRILKLGIMGDAVDDSAGGRWFGAGGSLFKASTVLSPTQYSKEHEWMFHGTRPYILFLFMQYGYLGLFWMLCVIIYLLDFKTSKISYFALGIKLYFLAIFLGLLVYNDAWESASFCFFMLMPLFLSSRLTTPPLNPETQID